MLCYTITIQASTPTPYDESLVRYALQAAVITINDKHMIDNDNNNDKHNNDNSNILNTSNSNTNVNDNDNDDNDSDNMTHTDLLLRRPPCARRPPGPAAPRGTCPRRPRCTRLATAAAPAGSL